MSVTQLDRITIEPSSKATCCVIWLHGLGDSGAGFSPIVPVLRLPQDHQIRFVFPHAPEQAVTINQGAVMRSWYDIKSMELHNRANLADVLDSEKIIQGLIQEQLDSGIASDKIVLAGFSQGGVMSLFTGLRYTQKLAGILAMSCYLPNGDQLPASLALENQQTPILHQHGEQDDVVPFSAGKMANQLLVNAGYQVQWYSYPMPHTVVAEQLRDISAWLQKVLK
ncbi:dienelactone hydrolase family protein [Psychromonas sp. SA13A]|uniref:alpha/beta hydrolase n=1 Tax=Psychromonas sp. SA13A TaxID=2686346 RepID=UPI00140B6FB1|nr:dienelactone hydrolase family protein [Psychromonas sp. SA13A]